MVVGVCRILTGGFYKDEYFAIRTRLTAITASEESINIWDSKTFDNMRTSTDNTWIAIPFDISIKLHQKGVRI
jgi:hypothetical protein